MNDFFLFGGFYMVIGALACVIIGLSLVPKYLVAVINGQPTLPVKWFLVSGMLFICSFSWIIGGLTIQ